MPAICHFQEHAEPIARRLISDLYVQVGSLNFPLGRLVYGKDDYVLGEPSLNDLKAIERWLEEALADVRLILETQEERADASVS